MQEIQLFCLGTQGLAIFSTLKSVSVNAVSALLMEAEVVWRLSAIQDFVWFLSMLHFVSSMVNVYNPFERCSHGILSMSMRHVYSF